MSVFLLSSISKLVTGYEKVQHNKVSYWFVRIFKDHTPVIECNCYIMDWLPGVGGLLKCVHSRKSKVVEWN